MNPKNFIPRAPPGSCFVFRPNGPGTTDFVSLQGTCGYLPMYVGSFNGVDGYVSIPHSSSLMPISSISISFWMKKLKDPLSGWVGLFYKRGSENSGYNGYSVLLCVDGSIRWEFPGVTNAVVDSSTLTNNKWYHVVTVYDSSSMKIFINGNLNNSRAVSGNIIPTVANLIIGRRGAYFNGTLANAQIYNTALTPQEIQYLYQQGLGGGPVRLQNLVGWWPLNGDAKDYSGNNNHGTINGGVTFVQNYNPP
jgi:hypothetical protein